MLIHNNRAPFDILARRIRAIETGEPRIERTGCRWPDEADLLAYREGRLGWFTRKRVEAHLAGCEDCRELLDGCAEIDEIGVLK